MIALCYSSPKSFVKFLGAYLGALGDLAVRYFLTNRKERIDAQAASRRVGHKERERGKEREFHK